MADDNHVTLDIIMLLQHCSKEEDKCTICQDQDCFDLIWSQNMCVEMTRQFSLFLAAVMTDLYEYVNPKNGLHSPLISEHIHKIIMANADVSLDYVFIFFMILLSDNLVFN